MYQKFIHSKNNEYNGYKNGKKRRKEEKNSDYSKLDLNSIAMFVLIVVSLKQNRKRPAMLRLKVETSL